MVHHHVQDYNVWKPVFDGHAAVRKTFGSRGGRVFRSASDPNEIVIVMEFDSMDHAHAFAQDPSLPEAMQRGGVMGPPEVFFLEEAARPSA
jgi:uncharacterized protein (DUF1330 family)